jgi:alpha-tubulin suppressor-like RCC1 family protein
MTGGRVRFLAGHRGAAVGPLAVAVVAAAVAVPAAAQASAAAGEAGRHAAAPPGSVVYGWGSNDHGQLGNPTVGSGPGIPVQVGLPPGARVTSVRVTCGHALALTSTGQVLAWGRNGDGELGDGSTGPDSATPVQVVLPAGTTVKAVRAGCAYSLALTSTGTVLAWGSNQDGQLGNGTVGGSSSGTPSPVRLPDGTIVKAISAGDNHALALTSTGRIYAWGANSKGQLGIGIFGSSTGIPIRVMLPARTTVTSVSAGSDFSLAMTANGRALSWGINFSGQLGNGRTGSGTDHPVRVELPKGTRVRGLIAGCAHTLALTATGKVLAWGLNQAGQLGNGARLTAGGHQDTPVKVRLPKRTTVRAVSAGCEHSLALTATGRLLAWGLNGQGQLGQGGPPFSASSTPARVKLPAGLTATAIGSGPDAQSSFAIVRTTTP